jgi:hypothetical protein
LQEKRQRLTPDQMEKLWAELALVDGAKAYIAISALQDARDQAVEFLKQHLRPVPVADAKHVQQLIESLNSTKFAERAATTKELKMLTAQFRVTIRKAASQLTSLEVKRRLESVLADAPRQLSSKSLRTLRSIQILERIGSTDASRLLRALADGAPEAHETRAAQSALQRLTMKRKNAP